MGSDAATCRVLPVTPTPRSPVEKDVGVPETGTAGGTGGPEPLLAGPHGGTGGRAAAAGGAPGDAGRVRGGVGAGWSGRYLRGRGLTWSGALKRAGRGAALGGGGAMCGSRSGLCPLFLLLLLAAAPARPCSPPGPRRGSLPAPGKRCRRGAGSIGGPGVPPRRAGPRVGRGLTAPGRAERRSFSRCDARLPSCPPPVRREGARRCRRGAGRGLLAHTGRRERSFPGCSPPRAAALGGRLVAASSGPWAGAAGADRVPSVPPVRP